MATRTTVSHDDWEDRQDSQQVTVDGHDLDVAYVDEGEGAPVVFLHGIPTWSFLWRQTVEDLKDEYRVIAPDLLGYGKSAQWDGFDRSIRAQEAMLTELLERLDIESATLVGHDIGGGVALRYAAHTPAAVDKLVLSNSACYDSWPVEPVAEIGLPSVAANLDRIDEFLDLAFGGGLVDDPTAEFINGMKAPIQSDEGSLSMVRNAAALNTNHTTEIDYDAITAETLLLWGAADEFQPVDNARRLAGDLDRTERVEIEAAGHWVPEDAPDAYTDHLTAFLD